MKSPVYVKTAKGLAKLRANAKDFSVEKLNILKQIDGQRNISDLMTGMSDLEQIAFLKAVKEFDLEGIIHALADVEEFDLAIAAMEVRELSPEESILAWAEANRGSHALKHHGFYANPARSGQMTVLQETDVLHVLIVDDDEAIVRLLTLLLEEKGLRVTALLKRVDVLAALRKKDAPNFVLLDVVLPSESGFDILESIRQSSDLCRVPVFMLTSEVNEASVLKGLNGGADGYMFKPFKWQTLYSCIQAVTG